MSEYISREEVKKILASKGAAWEAFARVNALPAADVVARDCFDKLLAENDDLRKMRPVVRGHIIEDETGYFWCSECGCNITLTAYTMPNNKLILNPNYCPNCGADMKEET